MTRIYAVAESVPEWTYYITPGKRYEVLREQGGGFYFIADTNQRSFGLWTGCGHLSGGNWTRVEVDESDTIEPAQPDIAQVLADALKPFVGGFSHTRVFLEHRERMHPAGQDWYREDVERARDALAQWEASKPEGGASC